MRPLNFLRAATMSQFVLHCLERDGLPPRPISPRLRSQLVYFATLPESATAGSDEYWFNLEELGRWLDDGVIELVSPLDTANMTEVELSEEQEALLGWLVKEKVAHVKLEERG